MQLPIKNKVEFILINACILICFYLLYQGITLPLMTFKQFSFFGNTFSLVSAIEDLKEKNQIVLYCLILFFSILLPFIKLLLLCVIWNSPKGQWRLTVLHWMILVGRWSMLDVMMVAVLVAWIKIDMIASVETHAGLYYFIAAVFTIFFNKLYITWRIKSDAAN